MRIVSYLFLNILMLSFCNNFTIAKTNEPEKRASNTEQSIKAETNKFGVLEIKLIDSITNEPVEDANVVIDVNNIKEKYGYEVDKYGSVIIKTDINGIARIKLLPGESGEVFPRNSDYYPPGKKTFAIEKDKTTSIEFNYVPLKFVGIVRDETGNSLEGVKVLLTHSGQKVNVSNKEGRFETEWDMVFGPPGMALFLIARDEERNLCIAERITKPDQKFDLKLKSGLALAGKIVDPNGKGVNNAGIKIILKGIEGVDGGTIFSTIRDSNTVQTDFNGKFEIKAIPYDFIYNFFVSAKGYGRKYTGELSSVHAEDNYLDIGTIVLPFSGYTHSGIGAEGKNFLLTGKKLPGLNDFYFENKLPELKNRNMLICLFDIEQRPSRNCIIELSKKAQELDAKGVDVILIHASKVEKEYLDNWFKDNNISFPIGMIESGEEKIKFNWGVKALPWLILTDKEHIVINEGFSISEIGEKLK